MNLSSVCALMQPESNLSDLSLPVKSPVSKPPTEILPGIFAFPPNRDTLGGTAYLLLSPTGNILIDSPAWHDLNQQFIADRGGVKSLVITHRGGIGATTTIAAALDCEVIIQEQEAYLLPELKVTTFGHKFNINDSIHVIWTSGHSPGSACVYTESNGGVLFTGRHLLPDQFGNAMPLRIAKTFHWKRQLRNVEAIWSQFPSQQPLAHICPGANTGLLRGKGSILVDCKSV
jgi:glyoxylase-like metal-dependent hydrolase (beta-lactamase superfamily II)